MKLFGTEDEKGRWILIFLGIIINICLGTVYSWSVFVTPLTAYFTGELGQKVTAGEILMPFSVFLACFAIAMPLTGKYLDKYGPRRIIVTGGLLTGLGWFLASFSTSVLMLYVLYGVVGGLGVGIAYGAPVAAAARWFPDRRGFAVGMVLLGFGFSAFITANLAGVLIGQTGVMGTFRIFGVAFVIITVLAAIPFRFPDPGWIPSGWTPPDTGAKNACSVNLQGMMRTVRFYALWVCYFIGCLAGLMAISISKPVGTEIVGIDAALGTMLVGFFAVFNGCGRPGFGALCDRLTPKITAILSFMLIGGASMLLVAAPSVPVYVMAFAVLWGCLGGWLAIAPASTARFFGTGDYPRCYGVIFLAYGAGAIAGPQIAGYIREITGSYLGVFPVVTLLAVIGIIVAIFLDDKR